MRIVENVIENKKDNDGYLSWGLNKAVPPGEIDGCGDQNFEL